MSNFITAIKIGKVRHLENIDIVLGDEKKHLILTGKNGSGKTSVLEELNGCFNDIYNLERGLFAIGEKNENISILFSQDDIEDENFIYAFFPAKRSFNTSKSKGIQKIFLSKNKTKRLNSDFLQYIINLKAERSFARDDEKNELVKEIDEWFSRFENILKKIYHDDSLSLKFDRRNIMSYNFVIEKENREVFDFHGLSDGYSSIIDIITEILLKVETTKSRSLDIEGIVLIDEIETHLHVELQKDILPLLTSFFPNIQFIVTTHSPFILSSLPNAVIYDLEKKIQVEDLSAHSYESLVDTYFDTDKYSNEVKEKLKKYKELTLKDIDNRLEREELKEYLKIEMFFENLPKYKNEEIGFQFNRIQQLKLGA